VTQRVVVFIDAQNMYRDARRLFFADAGTHVLGQFDPIRLGRLLCQLTPPGVGLERELAAVRVYTGRPASSRDPKTYGAHMRQCARWQSDGAVVSARTLRYPSNWPASPAQEKGIDVQLAIDLVTMFVDGAYDVAVVASTDTDLRPAVEYVAAKAPGAVEVAAWWRGRRGKSLAVPGLRVWCHRLTADRYDVVADHADYNIA
jgi:uncharacterized LabA/DUF88 family protein